MKVYKCGECGCEEFAVRSRGSLNGSDDVYACCADCGWEVALVQHPEEVVDLAGAIGEFDTQ